MAVPGSTNAPRFIDRKDVPLWLLNSEIDELVWHTTSAASKASFKAHGVRVDLDTASACAGFYCSRGRPYKGPLGSRDFSFEVAIRSSRALRCDHTGINGWLGGWTDPAHARERVLKAGYDAIIHKNNVVVGLIAENIRIVKPWRPPPV